MFLPRAPWQERRRPKAPQEHLQYPTEHPEPPIKNVWRGVQSKKWKMWCLMSKKRGFFGFTIKIAGFRWFQHPNIEFLSLEPKLLTEAVHFVPGPGDGGVLHLIHRNMPLSKYLKYYLTGFYSPTMYILYIFTHMHVNIYIYTHTYIYIYCMYIYIHI